MAVIKPLERKFKEDQPNRELVYEDSNAKVIRFYLKEGQEIKPHRSPSSVFISVLEGEVLFYIGEEGKETLREGGTVFYEPQELHGFKAITDCVVQAVITPNPTAKKLNLS
ncbi:MAG: cupin domain-containing protein [Aquificae bacterium]|nr:cupin domain-containing protein [Aquificota bacterium]